ncbi:hypothetical protein GCM10023093_19200 [Nemorincola caseinilytica]|uniref:Lipoprotein n=1 Tax=Nemorincola caseinilytica TaxID=2054315 RepID=A0ABP8NIF2_9BACT
MKAVLALFVIVLTLSACCTKKACVENDRITLQFYGFDTTELDTVYTTGYALGSGFTKVTREQRLDTTYLGQVDSNRSYYPYYNEGLSDQYEWEVYVPAVNRTYRFTDYSYSTFSCNCPQDKVRSLHGCKMNGIPQNLPVKINK